MTVGLVAISRILYLHDRVMCTRNRGHRSMSLRHLLVVPSGNIPRVKVLGGYPLIVQLYKCLLDILYLLLLRRSKSRQLSFDCIASQICLCFGEASSLRCDLGADSAKLGTGDIAVDVGELGSTCLACSMFSWALFFHVAPFPVAT
jgi:hypothetical protein